MRRLVKWLVVPAVVAGALLVAGPSSAEARRVVVRSYYPRGRVTYIYRHPRRIYYAPAPVVVPRRSVILYGPALPPPPVIYYSW